MLIDGLWQEIGNWDAYLRISCSTADGENIMIKFMIVSKIKFSLAK